MQIAADTLTREQGRCAGHGLDARQPCLHPAHMEAIVAFLDILGFKDYVATDIAAAGRLLGAHSTTLIRLEDQLHHPPSRYDDPGCRDLAQRHALDSFQQFLPMSDSIVIVGTPPEPFVEQLSTFLVDAFQIEGHAFAHPDDPASPIRQNMEILSLSGLSETKCNWFPALWRGGISYGQVEIATLPTIHNNCPKCAVVPFGSAVVEAVKLEGSGKGPRLFCSAKVAERVSGTAARLLVPCEACKGYEILWPASVFTPTNDPEIEKPEFIDLFLSARTLWISQVGTTVEPHYWEFLRLICRSAFHWASQTKASPNVLEYISAKIQEHVLPDHSSKLLSEKLR
jgi:hypothetical protein